jgi:hypothetical protein
LKAAAALSVVSFLQTPPRRSCTALIDAGPRGTFTLICKPRVRYLLAAQLWLS